MVRQLLFVLSTFFITGLAAQNTVGLLSYQPAQSYEGYNLIYPHNQPNVYLIDMCGEIVHVWEDDVNWKPGNTAYLRDDGSIVKTKRDAVVTDDVMWAGGGGEFIEIRNWDNDLVWSYEMNDASNRLHHDIAPMPNGNILAIAWEFKTEAECLQAGRDTATTAQDEFWPDWVFEINPETDEIVWEWHAWDHLIQDIDPLVDNFGVIADHPELIDINFEDGHAGHPDWMHSNSLDYNAELDQIMISVPYYNEVWIVDHSTTTAEAAGHVGGLSSKGGDLMYRWGNPITYAAGDSSDQKLFFQHNAHWATEFLDIFHPHYGKIAVFNNRVGEDFSQANVFASSWDMYSWSYFEDDGLFLPNDFDLTIQHPTPTELYSTGLSSVQCLPNGNSLITSGRFGYSFEITPDNDIVWEYKTPLVSGQPATQGDTLVINNNLTFRMYRYPTDYAAFDGQPEPLESLGWLELEPDSNYCALLVSVVDIDKYMIGMHPNPASDVVTMEFMSGIRATAEIRDLFGRLMFEFEAMGGRKYLDISSLNEGIYFVRIGNSAAKKLVVTR